MMALLKYVDDLNVAATEFAFVEVDDSIFLRFGRLTADGNRLYESIIGGYIGFFQDDVEVAYTQVVGRFHVNGIPVRSIPETLTLDAFYEVKSTQAQPGVPGESEGSVPLDVTLLEGVAIEPLVETTLMYTYQIGENAASGRQWVVKWYASVAAYEAGMPEMPADVAPLNVSIHPRVLSDREGEHIFFLTFTPQSEGAHYIGFDVSEAVADPARPSDGVILLDAEGFGLVDSVGYYLVQEVEEQWTFLVDADGDELIDADGFRLVEVS